MIRPGRARDAVRWGLIACAIAQTPACHTRSDEFYGELFTCDPTALQDQCGTTAAGKPMTCFLGAQLGGGSNFCVEACDPTLGASDANHTCVSSGALLQRCHPNTEASVPSRGCPAGLQCYRTDLLVDEGVCLMMRVCAENSDCPGDPARAVCAGTLVRDMSTLPAVRSDHLNCLKASCKSGGSLCGEGESCLGNYYNNNPELPDICVPNCDGNLHCPPNYGCAISLVAPGSPPICLPGLVGTRCVDDQDCAIGNCTETGGGLSECVVPLPCETDFDCEPFDRPGSTFVCVELTLTGVGKRCIGLTPFNGANCTDTSQCPEGQRCYRYSPYTGIDPVHGECRIPCDGGQACAARAGIPHLCLANGEGGCYPTNVGLPCTSSAECAATLACMAVTPDERTIIDSPMICTTSCATDDDCEAHPLIRAGFCKEGVCRIGGQKDVPCDRDAQCILHVCDVTGTGQCAL